MTWRRIIIVLHRDIGFFLAGLILIYCISGLALNHVDDWNPDFVVVKKAIKIPGTYHKSDVSPDLLQRFSEAAGESDYKVHDFPTAVHVKIYYDNATMLVDLTTGEGAYEQLSRRPLFFQSNLLHRNSVKGWKWMSDAFSVLLIVLVITGIFVLKGKKGITGRGAWLTGAGIVPPIIALLIFEFVQK